MTIPPLTPILLAFLAQGVSGQRTAPSDTAPRKPAAAPRLEYAEPPYAIPAELRDTIHFAWLTAPQAHGDPTSGTFRLAVSIIAPRTTRPLPDPIVLIPGGPGSALVAVASVDVARSVRLAPFREHRAIVLLDPRGHGLSEPAICPDLNGAQPLEEGDTLAEATLSAKLAACRAHLVSRGVRLETLSSVESAHDIDLLRRALDAPQVNLIGSSYGSRIAAEAMRTVPWAIRAVHMDGPVPPAWPHLVRNEELLSGVMTTLFRRCAERPACRGAFPRLEADYDSVLARAARSPLTVRIPRSDPVPDGEILVDSALLRLGLAQLGLTRELAAGAPLLVHTLATHGLDLLSPMASQLLAMTLDEGALGTNHAFLCNDSPVTPEAVTWLPRRCPVWIGERYGDSLAASLESDIPALIITGELDPRTPPSYAEFVARGLSRSHVVVAPWTGHERLPDCAFRIAHAFFEAPDRAPETACMDSVPPIRFVTDVEPSRWIGALVARAMARPIAVTLAAAVATLLLLVPFVGLPLRVLRSRGRSAAAHLSLRDLMTWLAAATGLALVAGVALALNAGARENILIPMLGVPRPWSWILALPGMLLALWLAALVMPAKGAAQDRRLVVVRWSGVAGGAALLGLWAFNLIR